MDLNSNELTNPYGLKNPVVKLERCDKIWKTLQLIRKMQDEHIEDIQNWIKREPITTKTAWTTGPPMTFIPDKSLPLNLMGEPNLPKPHIKYQPIFSNGKESLPPFQLAEKSRVYLYHCEVCSKEYCNYKRFADHQTNVHRILMPKKTLARKESIQNGKNDGDSKSKQNFAETNQQPASPIKSVVDENIDLRTTIKNSSTHSDSTKCKQCRKYFTNIKKHMIDHHKIKDIEVLTKVTDKNIKFQRDNNYVKNATVISGSVLEVIENNTNDQTKQTISQNVNFSVQKSTNIFKRKLDMPSVGLCKKLRGINSRKEQPLDTGNRNDKFKRDICDKVYAHCKSLSRHRNRYCSFITNARPLESKKYPNESVEPESVKKKNSKVFAELGRDYENVDDDVFNKTLRTGSGFTKEIRDSAQLKRDKLQIKCPCGRSFRSASILSNHKSGCKFLNDNVDSKCSDTRSGSERESGISITIKKKNNSYEIVSKEGSDEESLRNSTGAEEPEISGESSNSSSDNSDSSECDDQLENLIPEQSKYSVDHCILKLRSVDDDADIDIEGETEVENNEINIRPENGSQVPLLRVLCKKLFYKRGIIPKEETTHNCQICQIFLGSREKLTKHIERHKKLMKRSCTCGIKFTSVKMFDDHVAESHPNSIICPYCKENCKTIVGLGEHFCVVNQGTEYKEAFNESYPCPYCNITFSNITWLDSHMRSKHLDPNLPFQCYQCLDKFANEQERSLHSHKTHNLISMCSVCNRKFHSLKTKQKHEAYHRGVGFPCHNCKKTYRSKRNLSNHVKTVHSDFSNDKLQCPICEKNVKIKSVKKHVLRHNTILKCELCDRVVYDFRKLERHIIDCHEDEDYPRKKCNICGVSYPTKEQLDAHIMVEKSIRNKPYRDL